MTQSSFAPWRYPREVVGTVLSFVSSKTQLHSSFVHCPLRNVLESNALLLQLWATHFKFDSDQLKVLVSVALSPPRFSVYSNFNKAFTCRGADAVALVKALQKNPHVNGTDWLFRVFHHSLDSDVLRYLFDLFFNKYQILHATPAIKRTLEEQQDVKRLETALFEHAHNIYIDARSNNSKVMALLQHILTFAQKEPRLSPFSNVTSLHIGTIGIAILTTIYPHYTRVLTTLLDWGDRYDASSVNYGLLLNVAIKHGIKKALPVLLARSRCKQHMLAHHVDAKKDDPHVTPLTRYVYMALEMNVDILVVDVLLHHATFMTCWHIAYPHTHLRTHIILEDLLIKCLHRSSNYFKNSRFAYFKVFFDWCLRHYVKLIPNSFEAICMRVLDQACDYRCTNIVFYMLRYAYTLNFIGTTFQKIPYTSVAQRQPCCKIGHSPILAFYVDPTHLEELAPYFRKKSIRSQLRQLVSNREK